MSLSKNKTPGCQAIPGCTHIFPICCGIVLVLAVAGLSEVVEAQSSAATRILRELFVDDAFAGKVFGPARWLAGGQAYATLEPSRTAAGFKDIVRYETATGQRKVLVSAQQLTAPGSKVPLTIEDYSWSMDLSRLLIYTNSKRVWRAQTRGDYWVFEPKSGSLRKLGSASPPSSLMFAKFSPDARRVAYVRFNNIYVEDLEGRTWRLTSDGSEKVINGTSDWVYEEEFDIRDGFRWSPDATRIAYWLFDASKVRNFSLIYDTGGPYQVLTGLPYPEVAAYPTVRQIAYTQPGTENSSVRIGVVPAVGGETRRIEVPGYADQNYIAPHGMG